MNDPAPSRPFGEKPPQTARADNIVPFDCPADAVDYTRGAPENFPVAAFPELLREIGTNMADVYQTPACLPLMAALATLSGAVGKSVQVTGAFKDKATRLNLFVLLIAERGSGKGVIGETLCAPLARRSREMTDRHRKDCAAKRAEIGVLKRAILDLEAPAARASGKDQAELLKQLSEKRQRVEELETDIERKVELIVGDATSEGLARDLGDNHEALFCHSTEAGAAIKVALGKYSEKGEGDIDTLLSSYSGDSVRSSRVNNRKGVQLDEPCLALLWFVQGCMARRLFAGPEVIERGLTTRLLTCDTGARREHDNRKTDGFLHAERWAAFINRVLDRRFGGGPTLEIVCSPEAREVFAKFYDEGVDWERGPFADLGGEFSRWRENAIKIAGLFALAEELTEMSAELALRACAVMRWSAFNFLGLLKVGRGERMREEADRFEKLLRDTGGEVALGLLASSHGIKRPQVAALIAAFPEQFEIRRRPQAGAGRPAEFLAIKTKSSKSSKLAGEGN